MPGAEAGQAAHDHEDASGHGAPDADAAEAIRLGGEPAGAEAHGDVDDRAPVEQQRDRGVVHRVIWPRPPGGHQASASEARAAEPERAHVADIAPADLAAATRAKVWGAVHLHRAFGLYGREETRAAGQRAVQVRFRCT